MPVFISPFDERFAKFAAAARLTAEEHPTLAAEDMMDLFARAMFSGAFDPDPIEDPSEALGERNAIEYWVHIPIEAPVHRLTPAQRKLSPKPVEYFGANRKTIASVMHSISGLPGDYDQWEELLDAITNPEGEIEAFTALARTPFETFPDAGKRLLEGAYVPKKKLKRWFELREIPTPRFLDTDEPTRDSTNLASSPKVITSARTKRAQGRPQKSSWDVVISTLLKLREERPDMQKKALAFEARRIAAEMIPEEDLPSVATIQRKMAEILRKQRRH